jgi:CRP-like cAMP-binding protein
MMNMNLAETLKEVEFFRGLPDQYLEELASIAREVEIPAYHDLFQEDNAAKTAYVIVSGRVSLEIWTARLGHRQMMEVADGDFIGWSPLLQRSWLFDTARTLTRTRAVAFDGARMLALCMLDTRFGFELMRRVADVLAQRLAATRDLLEVGKLHLPQAVETD